MTLLGELESFLLGHHLSYTSCYFEQVLLAERLALQNEEPCQKHSKEMIEKLKAIGPNFSLRIRFVQNQVQRLNIPMIDAPSIPPHYQKWISTLHPQIVQFYPEESIEGWLFVLGNAFGELRCGLIVLLLSLDFQTQLGLNCSKTIQVMPKRLQDSCEKAAQAIQFLEERKSTRHLCNILQQPLSLIWNIQRGLQNGDQSIASILIQIQAILPEIAQIENPQHVQLPSRT